MAKDDKTIIQAPDIDPDSGKPSRRDLLKKIMGRDTESGDVPPTMADRISTAQTTRRNVLYLLMATGAALLTPGVSDAYAKLTVPKDYQAQTDSELAAQAMETYGQTEKYMRPNEVMRMQFSQETIDRHYMNPSFVMFEEILGTGRKNMIDTALKTAKKYPQFLEYTDKGNNVIEIRKRKVGPVGPNDNPSDVTAKMANIPDDFYIKIEKEKGYITQIGSLVLVNTMEDEIPWVDGEYAKRYKTIEWPRLITDFKRAYIEQRRLTKIDAERRASLGLDKGKSKEQLEKEKKERRDERIRAIYGSTSREVKNYIRINWMEMPKRLKELVEARNTSGWQIDDIEGYQYNCLKAMLEGMPATYEEMVEHLVKDGHIHGLFTMYPEYPDTYFIEFGYPDAPDEWLIVNDKGYFLKGEKVEKVTIDKNGNRKVKYDYKPKPTTKYKDILKKKYYNAYPEARGYSDFSK